MAPENKRIYTARKIAVLVLKLSVSAALFYLLISKIGTKTIIHNIKLSSPLSFISAVGVYMLAAFFSSLRWKLLIPQSMKTKRLFSMYMIGSFFNTCMPGTIGGDAVKAYYLSSELKKSQKSAVSGREASIAVASVFMDRYVGFSAMLVISMIAFPFGFRYLEGTPVKWFMPIVLAVFISGSIVVFKFRFGERLRFLFKVYEYFKIYSKKRDILFKAFLYSVFVQISGIFAVYMLSRGIALDIPFLSLLIFVPIIILISFIPVSISGIGLREGAFVIFLGTIGVSPDLSVTLSILWFLSVVVASLWGLFEYLRFKAVLGREVK
ncbi:MAG: lysylphosphatidylglycerol synthase transmembrane domain-containing protein [Nitrospiraceae bacterium]|nr:lysylphosphatidylglycerol synthase transmembrane domain-containing protein [Nitrospiraceae bacterium]